MLNNHLILFEDCRIVEGFTNALIYDLNRPSNSNFIPKTLIHFIEKCKENNVERVLDEYDINDRKRALEYLEFILEREFGFLADVHVKERISKLNMDYESSSIINNSIVCLDDKNLATFPNIQKQLDLLLCINLELRCINLSISDLRVIVKSMSDSVLETIIIRLIYCEDFSSEMINSILKSNSRIKHIYIYNSPSKICEIGYTYLTTKVNFVEDCGTITKDSFTINQPFFIESQSCNTCLNKKVSVDYNGQIKNCPSSQKSFGLIGEVNLKDAILNPHLKNMWLIKKDEIEVCKDCEYRHMCLDCRVFIDSSDNIYSRPSKCTYNPYIGKWEGESGFLPLEEFGVLENGKFCLDEEKVNLTMISKIQSTK